MERAKKELLEKTYQEFMRVGLESNDPNLLEGMVDENVMGFGTALDEKIRGIEEFQQLLINQKIQSEGIDLTWRNEPVHSFISEDENMVVFAEDVFFDINTEEGNLEMYLRFSAVLNFSNGQWKVIHWHGSKPEQVESEKDSWGIESYKQKAEELQKLVDEKTADLLGKNRELEIEAALERVRSMTMAMHSSADIGACILKMFEELTTLGVDEGTRFGIGILNHSNENNELWTARRDGEEVKMHIGNLDMTSHPLLKKARKAWKEQVPFHQYVLEGQDLLGYYQMLNNAPDYKIHIPLEKLPKKEIQHCFIFEHGFFYAFSPHEFRSELVQITQRFSAQFAQTYRRYLDLKKAEAQAREAEIQLALERVRARSMAMKNSDELHDVLSVLFRQFDYLGIQPMNVFLSLFDRENRTLTYRASGKSRHRQPQKQVVHVDSMEELKGLYDKFIHDQSDSVEVIFYSKEVLPQLFGIFSETFDAMPEDERMKLEYFPEGGYSMAGYTPFGYLGYDHQRQATEEEKEILSRFCKEFTRVYQRFLDIQKAEAQSRESQVQLSLERVRARSMAMHNSNELADVCLVLFEEISKLTKTPDRFNIVMPQEGGDLLEVWLTDQEGHKVSTKFLMSSKKSEVVKEIFKGWKEKKQVLIFDLKGKKLNDWIAYSSEVLGIPFKKDQKLKERFITSALFEYGYIGTTDHTAPSEEVIQLIQRFAKVFEQAYTRFLDLQKAEAQAREARIETALEKVRSRTMGMQSSAELPEVANLLFLEVQGLGVPSWSSGFNVLLEDKKSADAWMSSEGTIQEPFVLRLWGEASFDEMGSFIRSKDTFMVQELGGKALEEHYNYMKSFPDLQATFEKLEVLGLSLPTYQINHLCKFSNGFLLFITYEQVPEAHDIFKRFTKVFDQTYTRFLDLQKAESQAREAKIEAALERIRSHSIGMQSAADFGVVTTEMFEQLRNFGEDLYAAGIVFCDKHEGHVEQWHSIPGGGMLTPFIVPIDLDYIHQYRYDQWKEGKELFSIEIPGDFIEQHFKDIFELPSAQLALQDLESRNAPMPATPTWEIDYGASFKNGYILISSLKYLETTDILPRFARVFDQTYTRFLDLQKAEAQAREAQIEAALERVRSRTLAMQKSDELAETAAILFQQLIQLGIEPNRLYIGIIKDNSSETEFWTTEEDGSKISTAYTTDLLNNASFKKMYDAWKNKEKSTVVDIQGEELKEYIDYLTSLNIPFKDGKKQTRRIQYLAYFSKGFIGMASPDEQPRESIEILERFAYAFNLTFTRFNDLKVAESQAKEAQIELSLERIRAQVTAMRQSEELFDIVVTMRREFILLGHEADYFWHMKWIPESYEMSMTSEDGERVGMIISVPKFVHDEIPRLAEWEKSDSPTIALDLNGQEAWDYIDKMNTYGKYEQADPHAPTEEDIMAIGGLTFVIARTTHGEIGFSLAGQVPNPPSDSVETLVRFAGVFDLAYRRFEDLLNAEKQNRKAKIELALERVRARAMAMQEPEELVEVAQVMREEMGLLGVEELETSSIYINKSEGEAECWYSIKDIRDGAKTYIADHFDLKYKATWVGRKMLDFHQSRETKTSILMKGENRVEWINYCANQSTKLDGYYGTEIPERTYHLTKFSNGAIGAATPGEISDESWDLLQRAAAAFSLAYSRFKDLSQAREDLKKLKKAKSKAEKALKELKSAQEQLIQQEKLASLGQLTAGIAHEIKNPLNFVNNFSDLSRELIDEVFEEFENIEDSDSKEEILAILQDVKSNLSKVHEHGTRADAIVKSMLQHSRGNAGKIEAIDPNQLMREFANLAFHGMRAGKNPINVDLIFDLDPDAGLVNLVMEDFSRVILNICNNAFDAMRDRFKSSTDSSYLPKLTIQTKREKQKLILAFQDNGPGIPKDIVDKILQPFFTTKKGTEGTGLGLSITHDIIKAHGGELRVESEVGEGSTFSILLPLKMENV